MMFQCVRREEEDPNDSSPECKTSVQDKNLLDTKHKNSDQIKPPPKTTDRTPHEHTSKPQVHTAREISDCEGEV